MQSQPPATPPQSPPLIKRYPVPRESQDWAANRARMVVLGVDPGFAKGGVAVIERPSPQAKYRALNLTVLRTQKEKKKARNNLRVNVDDLRRNKELFMTFENLRQAFNPYAVGVEVYTTKGPIGGGQASKTMGTYMGIVWWAWARALFVAPFLPSDLKKRFCGKKDASKEDVERALYDEITDLRTLIQKVPKTMREHVADGAGHAVLVFEEVERTKKMLGLV